MLNSLRLIIIIIIIITIIIIKLRRGASTLTKLKVEQATFMSY